MCGRLPSAGAFKTGSLLFVVWIGREVLLLMSPSIISFAINHSAWLFISFSGVPHPAGQRFRVITHSCLALEGVSRRSGREDNGLKLKLIVWWSSIRRKERKEKIGQRTSHQLISWMVKWSDIRLLETRTRVTSRVSYVTLPSPPSLNTNHHVTVSEFRLDRPHRPSVHWEAERQRAGDGRQIYKFIKRSS